MTPAHSLRAILEAGARWAEMSDPAAVLENGAATAASALGAAVVGIWAPGGDGALTLVAGAGPPEHGAALADCVPGMVHAAARTRAPLLQGRGELRGQIWPGEIAVLPLVTGETLRGVLACFFEASIGQARLDALSVLATMLACSVGSAARFAAEQAARSEAETQRIELYSLFSQAPAMIAVFRGPSHAIELSNPLGRRLLGSGDILGRPFREAVPELAGQGLFELLDHVYASGKTFSAAEFPVRLETKGDGVLEDRYFNFVFQPTRDSSGCVDGVFAHGIETTEQVAARRKVEALLTELQEAEAALKEAVRAREQFLSIAAHELRTPVTSLQLAVQSMLRLLRRTSFTGAPPKLLQHVLETVERQGKQLTKVVDNLLDSARIASGQALAIELGEVDLTAVTREVAESFRDQLIVADCPLVLRADRPVIGCWDRFRLEQLIANLLSNAARYGAGKPVEVVVDASDGLARLSVSDHGVGVAPEMRAKIFEPFKRGASLTGDRGLGLGLYIVRQIVEALGGSIRVDSEVGAGSTFLVELPCAGPTLRAAPVA